MVFKLKLPSLFLLLLLVQMLSPQKARAQHCPFDGAYVFVVGVLDSATKEPIYNLDLYFLDSNNQVINYQYYQNGSWQEDTFFLWQNPDSTTHCGIIDNNHPMNPNQIRFWFAENHYVWVGGDFPASQLVIRDRRASTTKKYPSKIVSLKDQVTFPLCTGHSDWDRGPEGGFVDNYTPLIVYLKTLDARRETLD